MASRYGITVTMEDTEFDRITAVEQTNGIIGSLDVEEASGYQDG